ncbi:MAG: GGDEF domain-containing protein [Actinomycetia bacterium]|nr:GGDEF domain-containing protein [Actinomycetes bacterium]
MPGFDDVEPPLRPRLGRLWLSEVVVLAALVGTSRLLAGWWLPLPGGLLWRLSAAVGSLGALLLLVDHVLVARYVVAPWRRRAAVDPLTGLLRPEAFWAAACAVWDGNRRAHRPCTFAFIDLDDFKRVNDTAGHAAGDAVLMIFGGLLRAVVPRSDVVGRLGGEEFGWLLGGASPVSAQTALERLLLRCRSGARTFSFSAGVATAPPDAPDVTLGDLVAAAEAACYAAKRAGKGRIVVAPAAPQPDPRPPETARRR